MKSKTKSTSTSFSLTREARRLLARLAAVNGISRTAMLEVLIRERAKKEGLRQQLSDKSDSL